MIGIYAFKQGDKIVYVGKSINIKRRRAHHLRSLRKGVHSNSHFQRSFNKYGEDSFSFEILEECSEIVLNEREKFWIEKTNAKSKGFNQNVGGDGGSRTFGVNSTYPDELVHLICNLLAQGKKTSEISLEVFGEVNRTRLDYIGAIRRGEKRVDISRNYSFNPRINERRTIPDEQIHEICRLMEEGFSNKEISIFLFNKWDKGMSAHLSDIRNQKRRKNITKQYSHLKTH